MKFRVKIERRITMTFSDKIKRSREVRHLTQQQLADLVGVSKRTIASYESENKTARSSTIRKLADALQVSVDYLSNDSITDPEYGLEKQEYVEQTRELYGDKAAREMDSLLEKNTALFAGGELSQEAKDDFFQAVMKAYLTCKEEARKTYGRKK